LKVDDVAFSPDGRTLAAGGSKGTLLWDVRSHPQLGGRLNGRQGAVGGVAFSPDGRTLATAGTSGTVALWQGILWNDDPSYPGAGPAYLEKMICSLVRRDLTRTEWQAIVPGLPYSATCRY
jgi:hypothetical protein